MARHPPCLSLLLLLAVVGQAASELRICAYNLQEFNKMKASNYRVKNLLMRVRDNVSGCCPSNLDFCCCCCWVKQRCLCVGGCGCVSVSVSLSMSPLFLSSLSFCLSSLSLPLCLCLSVSLCLSLQVLSRCHISLLQEVMDPDGSTIKSLLASLNRYS